jgi:hypothetical protein
VVRQVRAKLQPSHAAGSVDHGGFLSGEERGALGLVVIGSLGYVRGEQGAGICPRDMAALLRNALLRLATSSAVVVDDGNRVGGPGAGGTEPWATASAGVLPAAE